MALAQNPAIVTNGLVFYYDMSNIKKSWRGKPTINYIGNGEFANGAGIDNESGSYGNNTIVTLANPGSTSYVLRQGPGGGEYEIHPKSGVSSSLLPSTTYCMSIWVAYTYDWNGNSLTLHSRWYDGSGNAYTTATDGTIYETQVFGGLTWQRRYTTFTTPSTTSSTYSWYLGYPTDNTTGYRYITSVQLEEGTFPTPFVNGTRYANSNLESSPSYPSWNTSSGSSYSGGTLTFTSGSYNSKGGWDLYKTYSGLSTSTNYTWSALVKLGTASNLIITMNNTQAWNTGPSTVVAGLSSTDWTRVAITGTTNTGSFNLHLGASNNTEVTATVQSAGTVFIQDVRLVLSQSQTAISDMMDKNTINASSLTYNSDGTFSFNGSGNYLSIPDNALIRPSSGFITTEIWFKSTSTGGQNASILINKENEYEISAGGGVISYAFRPNWAWVGATAYNLNQIYCVTITYDQSYQRMYLNGVQVYNAALSGAIGNIYSDTLKIGARGGAASTYDYFPGYIYNVKIYDRGLSVSEVLQNFNAQRGLYGV